jgi:hypothetical protein
MRSATQRCTHLRVCPRARCKPGFIEYGEVRVALSAVAAADRELGVVGVTADRRGQR